MKNLVFIMFASLVFAAPLCGYALAAEFGHSGGELPWPLSGMKVRIVSGAHVATFQLYDTQAAKQFYDQLPLTLELENFRDAQWMFFPPEKLAVTAAEAYHDGKKGELSYYAPWGDVFMLYKDFYAGDEMHRLGVNLSGIDEIESMAGSITIEPLEDKGNTMSTNPQSETTAVNLVVGDTRIPAVLGDNKTAKALIEKLPFTMRLSKYEHDFCGHMADPLPYDAKDKQNGWTDGDISFDAGGNYFAILYKDQAISKQFGNLVPMGRITGSPLVMDTLDDSISLTIELAE